LFRRLLEQAVVTDPVPVSEIVTSGLDRYIWG